jgi:hypothetical protein
MGHLNWKGEWIPDESAFEKAREYSLKQELVREFMETARKYQGIVKDSIIAGAAKEVVAKYSPFGE